METIFTIENANSTVRFGIKVYEVEKKKPSSVPI